MMSRAKFQYYAKEVTSQERAYELACAPGAEHSYETLISILSQKCQMETRRTCGEQQTPRAVAKNFRRFVEKKGTRGRWR
jgi:Na+-translocating ferredoxin:NAD+ oxidoreductase RNF subunit RnfB